MEQHTSHDWVSTAARTGYAARGVVYLLVGGLALVLALGIGGGETTGPRGALDSLLGAPFGQLALLMIAAGLVGYSIWRAIQTIIDVDGHGLDIKGIVVRAGLGISAITHLALAFYALRLAIMQWTSNGGGASWTGMLLDQPWGRWLLGAVGAILIGVGVAHAVKAYKAGFEKYFDVEWNERGWLHHVCRFGLLARGAVFAIFGSLVIISAWRRRQPDADSTETVLEWLHGQAFGDILLGLMAAGLIAFGIYSVMEARYRRVGID